jgi:uncharacterized protein involved in response to NO
MSYLVTKLLKKEKNNIIIKCIITKITINHIAVIVSTTNTGSENVLVRNQEEIGVVNMMIVNTDARKDPIQTKNGLKTQNMIEIMAQVEAIPVTYSTVNSPHNPTLRNPFNKYNKNCG